MKTSEMREKSTSELRQKLVEVQREFLGARIQKSSQQLKNPLKLRWLRRDAARILTIIREKENKGRDL